MSLATVAQKVALLFLIPIEHIAVASQAPPALLRVSSAARDLWLCNVLYSRKKVRFLLPLTRLAYSHPHGTNVVCARATIAQKVALLFLIPIDHIAVASQSPPTLLRVSSAARDLWLCKISMAPIDQPFVAFGNRIPHGTIFVSARATNAQKVALWE